MRKYLLVILSLTVLFANAQTDSLKNVKLILDSVYINDQFYRLQRDSIIKNFGFKSNEYEQLSRKEHKQDSLNLVAVGQIVKEYGWLSKDEVGYNANMALFLVVQHSPRKVQEEFYPVLKNALGNKKLEPRSFALFDDRVAMNNGKYQTYGTQLIMVPDYGYVFYPIKDVKNINKKRDEIGLSTIQEYAKIFGVEWSLDKYYEGLKHLKSFSNKYRIPFPDDLK